MSDELPYRYASTLGRQYALPIYFADLSEAQRFRRLSKRLKGLPGQDSMRIEEYRDGEWVAVDVLPGC